MVLYPSEESHLGSKSVLQEVQEYSSISVLFDNWEQEEVQLDPGLHVGTVHQVNSETTNLAASNTVTAPQAKDHMEFQALPRGKDQLVSSNFCLDSSSFLQRESLLWKEVIKMLLQYIDVVLIGGYGDTNLISHSILVEPGTTPITLKHWPLNPVIEESLWKQINQWISQRQRIKSSKKRIPRGHFRWYLCRRRTAKKSGGPWTTGN